MSLERLLVHDITVVHPATKAGRGADVTKDWTNATRSNEKGWITQLGTSDPSQGSEREMQVSDWQLFTMPDVVIFGGDRIEWSGLTFEVDGVPHPAWSPRGEHHTECRLKAVSG